MWARVPTGTSARAGSTSTNPTHDSSTTVVHTSGSILDRRVGYDLRNATEANVLSGSTMEVQANGRSRGAGGDGGVIGETPREPHSTASLEIVGGRDVAARLIGQPWSGVGDLDDEGLVVGPERHLDERGDPQRVGEQFVRRQDDVVGSLPPAVDHRRGQRPACLPRCGDGPHGRMPGS